MGSFKSSKKSEQRGLSPGKINASLNKKLQNIEWGEYRLGDLFEVKSYKKRFDANKVSVLETGKFPYIVRMSTNNGQKGFIEEDETYLNEGNTISFGQDTATMFYQEHPYFTGDKIKILKAKESRFNKNNAQFLLTIMKKSFSSFSWGSSSFSIDIIENQKITLPIANNKIDFDFMESFIRELEEARIRELEEARIRELSAYLTVSGLKDYILTAEEQKALNEFENLKFDEYDVIDIFDVKNTGNILSSDIVENSGTIPYLCASAENNAVSTYISYNKKALNAGNCVFIGGKTFVVTYQGQNFYSNDSHNLALYLKDQEKNKLNQLYLATCVYKSLNYKYSWGNSISKTKIQKDTILLPTKNNAPAFTIMETFISAIQKLVIKEVVLYTDRKIQATKTVVSTSTSNSIDNCISK